MNSLRTGIPTRRTALFIVAGAMLAPLAAAAGGRPQVTMHRDPNCGCCGGWAEHLRASGFPVSVVDTARINAVKTQLGVPSQLWSCHTAQIGNYVVEGHVPASAIERLLAEQPAARGLAVPGMPIGSPGMEGGEEDTYDVVLFGPQGQRVFARYRGARPI
jgi:hypothetical protein